MRNLNEAEKREELRKCLLDLSKSQECLKEKKHRSDCFLRLESIYCESNDKKFRHFYSDIFAIVSMIDSEDFPGSIDILAQNLQVIKDGYAPMNLDKNGNTIDISNEILKLYDHVNLDVARLSYVNKVLSQSKSDINALTIKSEKLGKTVEQVQEENENLIKNHEEITLQIERAKQTEKNYITILGIFASIVLAFTGGLAFSTSVLENINAVSPYRLAFIVEGLAAIFINVIYILVWFIQKVHDSGDLKYPPFMMILNGVLIVAIIITAVCWCNGVAEMVEMKNQLKICK